MKGLSGTRRLRRLFAAFVVLAAVVASGSAAGAQNDAAADQRVVRLLGSYTFEPDQGRIDVVEQITVSNVKGSQRSGDTITTFFWTGHNIWIPADADNVSIEVEGQPLEWEIAETVAGINIIDADYRRNLNFGQTRVIDVTYSLPTYTPGEGARRINEALFEVELLICCNFEEIDLTVSIPASFDVDPPTNLQFASSTVGGRQEFTFTDNEDTGQFTELIFTDWFGFDEAGLSTTEVPQASGSLDVVYPPDDNAWGEEAALFADETTTELTTLLQTPGPGTELTFRQGQNRGFGPWGVNGPFDQPVTLPRDYSRQGLAATLAKAWLDDGPFTDQTISDGLANDFAAAVLQRTGGTPPTALPPSGSGELSQDGAYWVMQQVSNEIGHDGLGRIVAMARAGETAYVGDGEAETTATIDNDWRRFVDLAEQRLGSAQVVPVFEEHVLDEQQIAQLNERTATIADYERLGSAADGVVPVGIRTAMTNWEFEEAGSLLITAQEVVAERERIIGTDAERAADPELAFGESWSQANSVEDLEAVRTSLLDRESDLAGGLWRTVLIGLGILILLGLLVTAFAFFSRRNRTKVVTPLDAGPAAQVAAVAPNQPPPGPGGPGPESWGPPTAPPGQPPVGPSHQPPPGQATVVAGQFAPPNQTVVAPDLQPPGQEPPPSEATVAPGQLPPPPGDAAVPPGQQTIVTDGKPPPPDGFAAPSEDEKPR